MKHYDSGGNTFAAQSGNLLKIILALVLILGMLLLQGELWAQCTMLCKNPDPSAPMMIPIDDDCNAMLEALDLLTSPQECLGSKDLVLRSASSAVVAQGKDSLTFFATDYLNQTLSVTVTDSLSGTICVNFVVVVDKSPPVISCSDTTITCVEESMLAFMSIPPVTDNCEVDVNVAFLDEIIGTDCNKMIKRTWIAVDRSKNEGTCIQNITITRLSLDSIIFPKDTLMSCDTLNIMTIEALGQPTLKGIVLDSLGSICNIYAAHVDSLRQICGDFGYEIHRYWTVTDSCTNETVRDTQVIRVEDKKPPTIYTQEMLVVSTDPGLCSATVTLPEPTLSDNCDPNARFYVSTSYGAVGLGPHPRVPVGSHTVQYTAVDTCGNTRVWTMLLSVVDQEAPSAVCEQFTGISLPNVGIVKVPAKVFDKGSKDNCASKLYFKIKKQIPGTCDNLNGDDDPMTPDSQEWFDDDLFFCCSEANSKTVPVVFRVYEVNPGAGPVNPARELPGGDLYGHFNECVIQVEVQDKLAPAINCPKDTVIDCTADYSNLSIFGNPGVKDNCGFTLDSTITRNINECGTGTITRTFRARDAFGNESSCTQTITVANKNPLKMEDIEWPKMYVTEFCNAKVDPSDLPAGYDKPKVDKRACNLVAIGYNDQVFDIAKPACYKILRTWEVIDWCTYEPSQPDRGGKFSYVQVIKVEDRQAPVLTCPGDVLVATSNSCGPVQVTLANVTATDCNTNITITNDSPYATAKGANASGMYPPGIQNVTFTATDGCGNIAQCKIKITVEDRTPPGPVCIVGLSTNLTNTDGQIKAIVKARQFNGGSSDNCTPANKLKYTLRRAGNTQPPIDTQLVFTCEDIGSQLVEFWVTDEKGNSAQCVTFIAVQDNNLICPAPAVGMVAGGIETERGDLVEGVHIKVNNSNTLQALTGYNGYFEFPNLPIGKDYTIVPDKDGDLMNGVTTFDIVLISKHILGIQRLDSPYKLIAADVDRSGGITAIDLIRLRKILLGIERTLPNNQHSWRFVDAKHRFTNPENPFQREFPEIYNINDFDGKPMDIDFVAIKVGDVNGTAQANSASNVETRASARILSLTTMDRNLKAGETFTIDFNPNITTQLIGYQFAMRFDPNALEFITFENGDLPDMSETNFNTKNATTGLLLTSWNTASFTKVAQETILFSLTFRAKNDGKLSQLLQIEPRQLNPEAYDTENEAMKIALQFKPPASTNDSKPSDNEPIEGKFELYQNAPNPFATQTVVSFRLPKTSVARLMVFDANGRTVYNKEGTFNEGYNEIIITRDEVQGEGMLYYRLETQEGKNATRKMMLLD